jgi:hypothetical protein
LGAVVEGDLLCHGDLSGKYIHRGESKRLPNGSELTFEG